jgi:hypothetical protein
MPLLSANAGPADLLRAASRSRSFQTSLGLQGPHVL